MLQVIDKGRVKMLVVNEGEEIIITSSRVKNSYTSIYDDGKNFVIDGTVNKNNYNIPYQERKKMDMEKAIKEQEG